MRAALPLRSPEPLGLPIARATSSPRGFGFALALIAGLGAMACHRPVERSVHPDKPDVVLIVVDTLRMSEMNQYGYARPTAVALDRFAAESTRFTRAWAPAPWTLPSTATALSGLLPASHKVRHLGDVLPDEVTTLAERLQAAGWTTGGFSHNHHVSPLTGFSQGFETFEAYQGSALDAPFTGELVDMMEGWLDEKVDERLFLYSHPLSCHGPYEVPWTRRRTLLGEAPSDAFVYGEAPMKPIMNGRLKSRERVKKRHLQSHRDQYDTAIRYTLDEVGRLLEGLRESGVYDDALIILTADHGEELYDHQGFGHGYSLYDEVLRVPLFVKLPGQKEGAVSDVTASLADIVPTVLSLVGEPVPEGLPGRSLLPALAGAPDDPDRVLLFDVDWPNRCQGRGVLRGSWKLITLDACYDQPADARMLFNLAEDPGERRDLAKDATLLEAQLRAELLRADEEARALGLALPPPANVAGSMNTELLRMLGYVQ